MGRKKKETCKEKYDWVFDYTGRSKKSSYSHMSNSTQEQEDKDGEGKKGKGFFACYLLTSLSPRHKGHSYIGFTVNPKRRIRQHNGEIGSGAASTKRKRPWEMVMCIYGFPTNVSALQFEWAWQHPTESLAVSKAAATFKSLKGLKNKIKLAFTMLALPKWQNLDLIVNFFSSKYSKHIAGSPVPEWTSVQFSSMEDLPCYTGAYIQHEDDDELVDDEMGANDAHTNERSENNRDNGIDDSFHWTAYADGVDDITLVDDITNEGLANKGIEETSCRRESDDSFNGFFDFSIYNDGPEDDDEDLARPEDLNNLMEDDSDQLGLAKVDIVEMDDVPYKDMAKKANEKMVEKDKKPNEEMAKKVEVIDLLSPSPGYYMKSKRRRASRGVIDLTQSPIFVEG